MLYPNELLFDDATHESEHAAPSGYASGYEGPSPYGYEAAADDFPDELLIPESEWQARIEEREANGLQLSQRIITAGLPCKSQSQTLFCWANAVTHSLEVMRVLQNEPMVILSPASVACPITGFRNIGGMGFKAMSQISTVGAVPVDQWPANAIDKKYYTKANMQIALAYQVAKWMRLQPNNLQQLVSLLLRDIPVPIGLPWWSHLVTAYDAVWANGKIGIRPRNSWGMQYGHLGFFTLQGSKMYSNDAVAPLSAVSKLTGTSRVLAG